MDVDVFNGDADGLCALQQWRLEYPVLARRISGVKRDIQLLKGLDATPSDRLTVLDISFDSNRPDVLRLLEEGVSVRWFDHHFSGDLPHHRGLHATIDTAADVCTSLLVDQYIGGRHRPWAVVGAFGDNMHDVALRAASGLGLSASELALLAELGELLNYNSYGDTVADLHFAPDALFAEIEGFEDPLTFVRQSSAFDVLRAGFDEDIARASRLEPCFVDGCAVAYQLPDTRWARRVVGIMANRLASAAPERAHALLVPNAAGSLTVSVRAPKARPSGADVLCRHYATGGGRKAAAGINHLPLADIISFLRDFSATFHD